MITDAEMIIVWRTIAAIMHLRSTRATPASIASRSSLMNEESGKRAAQLLGEFIIILIIVIIIIIIIIIIINIIILQVLHMKNSLKLSSTLQVRK